MLDIDGDGVLSLFELVYFYEEVLQRLQELNIDCLSVENTVCQILDMINPRELGTCAAQVHGWLCCVSAQLVQEFLQCLLLIVCRVFSVFLLLDHNVTTYV